MTIFQCPRCELRFTFSSELVSHLDQEHPDFHSLAGTVEDDLLAACHCHH